MSKWKISLRWTRDNNSHLFDIVVYVNHFTIVDANPEKYQNFFFFLHNKHISAPSLPTVLILQIEGGGSPFSHPKEISILDKKKMLKEMSKQNTLVAVYVRDVVK